MSTGVATDESVLVEVFAHKGQLKRGQRHKIAGDALKLITSRERKAPPRLGLAFADPQITNFFAGTSWLAAAVNAWEIEVIVAELDDAVREGIRAAQARQVMVNPSPSL